MRSFFLITVSFFFLAISTNTLASKNEIACRGTVAIDNDYSGEVILHFSKLQEGGHISLYHPITMDTENVVQLVVQKIIKTDDGMFVIAIAGNSNNIGIYSFKMIVESLGNFKLKDFKGFEAQYSFGPADLNCDLEN